MKKVRSDLLRRWAVAGFQMATWSAMNSRMSSRSRSRAISGSRPFSQLEVAQIRVDRPRALVLLLELAAEAGGEGPQGGPADPLGAMGAAPGTGWRRSFAWRGFLTVMV